MTIVSAPVPAPLPTRPWWNRPDRWARAGLVALGVLLLAQLTTGPSAWVAMLYGLGAAAALVAARQMTEDDVLAWSLALSVTVPVAGLVVAAHMTGLPGYRPESWRLDSVATVVACGSVWVAALACRRRCRRAVGSPAATRGRP